MNAYFHIGRFEEAKKSLTDSLILWPRTKPETLCIWYRNSTTFHDLLHNSSFLSFIISNISIATVLISETEAVLQVSDFSFRNIVVVYLFKDAVTLYSYLMSLVGRLITDELDTFRGSYSGL